MGGGVKSYLQAKRQFILDHTPHEHLMIVPGSKTEQVEGGRGKIWKVRGPLVNRTSRYRHGSAKEPRRAPNHWRRRTARRPADARRRTIPAAPDRRIRLAFPSKRRESRPAAS